VCVCMWRKLQPDPFLLERERERERERET
jgi:hypothetical protein